MKYYLLPLWVSSIILCSCSSAINEDQPGEFQVSTPIVSDTSYAHEYVAEIAAVQNVEIRSHLEGFIESLLVDEGSFVHRDQPLFIINSQKYRQELQKCSAILKGAIADLKSSEIDLGNVRKLFEKNIVAKTELELAKARAEAAKAKVLESEAMEAQAKINLAFTEVKAPFDGVINRIPNKTGSLIGEGTLLTTISDTRDVFAYFNLSEKDYLNLHESKTHIKSKNVTLVLANGIEYRQEGTIETVESEFDQFAGTIAFRARFSNPDKILKHGAVGKIILKEDIPNAIMIPMKSTFEIQDQIFVYVVSPDSVVEQRRIVPLIQIPHLYVVKSGIKPGEKFIYEGVQHVSSGDKIVFHNINESKKLIADETNTQ